MKKTQSIRLLASSLPFLGLSICLTGCGVFSARVTSSPSVGSQSTSGSQAGSQAVSIDVATATQCSAGGKVYTIFTDTNGNGVKDSSEPVISTQTVCNGTNGTNGTNGANGTNGLNTLASMTRVTTDIATCASGAGIQINTGLDSNKNSVLDPSEITQTQVLCDGATGAPGAAGAAGNDGHGVVFSFVSATSSQCTNGGVMIVMATDINNSGVYSAQDPNQQSAILCNGQSAVATYLPVDVITPCGVSGANNNEILLRLNDGDVLASLSDFGGNTGLVLLADGNYVTTVGSSCSFSLSTSGDRSTRSVNWYGSVQKSWPVTH